MFPLTISPLLLKNPLQVDHFGEILRLRKAKFKVFKILWTVFSFQILASEEVTGMEKTENAY